MNSSSPRPRFRSLLREPLLHFAAIGALLFVVETVVTRDGDAKTRRIVVESALVRELSEDFERQEGRPPSKADIEAMIDRWIGEEVLYREALRLGLDRDDPRIRQRLAAKMAFVLERRRPIPPPTAEQLRAWFDAHPDDYRSPLRLDFTHVFVRGADDLARSRARDLQSLLERGADPAKLGDSFSGGRRYRRRALADLERAFGEDFAAGLAEQAPDTWQLRESRHGLHLVRIDGTHSPDDGDLERQRLRVELDWIDAERARLTQEETEALVSSWEIVRP